MAGLTPYEQGQAAREAVGATAEDLASGLRQAWDFYTYPFNKAIAEPLGQASVAVPLALRDLNNSNVQVGNPYTQVNREGPVFGPGTIGPAVSGFTRGLVGAAPTQPVQPPSAPIEEVSPPAPTWIDRAIQHADTVLAQYPGRNKTDEQIMRENRLKQPQAGMKTLAQPPAEPPKYAKDQNGVWRNVENLAQPQKPKWTGYFEHAPLGSGPSDLRKIYNILEVEPEKLKDKDVPVYRDALINSMSTPSYDAAQDPQVIQRVNGIIENMYAMKQQRAEMAILKQQQAEAQAALDEATYKARYGDNEEPNPQRDKMYSKADSLRTQAEQAHRAAREAWGDDAYALEARSKELAQQAEEMEQQADEANESGLHETALWWSRRAQEIRQSQLNPIRENMLRAEMTNVETRAAHYGEMDLTRRIAAQNAAQLQEWKSKQAAQEMAARARQEEKDRKQIETEQRRQESAQRAIGNRAIRFINEAAAPIKKEVAALEKQAAEMGESLGIDIFNPADIEMLRESSPETYAAARQILGRLNMKRRALGAYEQRLNSVRGQYFPESASLAQVQVPQETEEQAQPENILPGGFIAPEIPQRGR